MIVFVTLAACPTTPCHRLCPLHQFENRGSYAGFPEMDVEEHWAGRVSDWLALPSVQRTVLRRRALLFAADTPTGGGRGGGGSSGATASGGSPGGGTTAVAAVDDSAGSIVSAPASLADEGLSL